MKRYKHNKQTEVLKPTIPTTFEPYCTQNKTMTVREKKSELENLEWFLVACVCVCLSV